jgi:hypothetical protein
MHVYYSLDPDAAEKHYEAEKLINDVLNCKVSLSVLRTS